MLLLTGAVVGTLAVVSLLMIIVAWVMGARFDLAFDHLKGTLYQTTKSAITEAAEATQAAAHGEL